MPTTSSIASSGGDYTTTQAWVDDLDSSADTHTGEVANEYIDGQLLINNASTAATKFILNPASGANHDGRSRNVSGSGAALRHTDQILFWFEANNVELEVNDLVLEQTAGSDPVVDVRDGGFIIRRCVVEKRGTATGQGIAMSNANIVGNAIAHDTIVYGHSTFGIEARASNASVVQVQHCTVYGDTGAGTFGILPSTGTNNTGTSNNISVGHSSEDYFGTDSADSNHGGNIAEDLTADDEWNGGGSSHNSVNVEVEGNTPTGDYVAFKNVTAGSEDFHIVTLTGGTGSNVALEGGLASQGSGTDIDRGTRDASTPDIGADEQGIPAAGGVVVRRPLFTLLGVQ